MRMLITAVGFAACWLLVSATATAQSNVDPDNKFAWQENTGFVNFRDAGGGADGVVIGSDFFSGFAWSENAGFINFGDGAPANGVAYSNTDGSDHGVNVLSTGFLDGLAWAENLGWVNCGAEPFIGADGARLEDGRLRGWCWLENAGWLNLDDMNVFVAVDCPGDLNNDGLVDGADLGLLLLAWAPSGPVSSIADLNGDNKVDGADLGLLLLGWGPCV